MLTITDLELRAGPRVLMQGVTYLVAPGDRIGLVGRNGAGKTTLTKVLAGEAAPAAGTVTRTGEHRLPAAGPAHRRPRSSSPATGSSPPAGSTTSSRRCATPRARWPPRTTKPGTTRCLATAGWRNASSRLGGYAAESEAASIASSLGLPERVLGQPLGTLSGGQRRRVELARILFSGAETLLLDEPTNHLDADSIAWLRDYLRSYKGGLVVISHDVELLDTVVNRVFHLDANRAELDIYNLGWKTYLQQRETDERRRKRERANAERKATALKAQADKMRAKATKAKAAQGMERRAERLLAGLEEVRAHDRTGWRLRFPTRRPAARRR